MRRSGPKDNPNHPQEIVNSAIIFASQPRALPAPARDMSKSGGRSGLHAGGCDRDGHISYIPAGSKSATKLFAVSAGAPLAAAAAGPGARPLRALHAAVPQGPHAVAFRNRQGAPRGRTRPRLGLQL